MRSREVTTDFYSVLAPGPVSWSVKSISPWNNWYKLLKSWVVIGCQQITAILLLISCFMKRNPGIKIACVFFFFFEAPLPSYQGDSIQARSLQRSLAVPLGAHPHDAIQHI